MTAYFKEPKENFIFDSSKVMRETHFTFGTLKGERYFGFYVPKNIKKSVRIKDDLTNKYTAIDVIQQEERPIFITYNSVNEHGNFWEVTDTFLQQQQIKITDKPLLNKPRFDLATLDSFTSTPNYPIETPLKIFTSITASFNKYVYYSNPMFSITIALWVIGTYFFDAFTSYPYIELFGFGGTGKSKTGMIISFLAKDGVIFNSLREATLFRYTNLNKPTLILEEVQRLFNRKKSFDDDRIDLLLVGWQKGAKVPREAKDKTGQFRTQLFDAYCPKVFIGTKEIPNYPECVPLKDRTISFVMTKPPKKDKRSEIYPEEESAEWQSIRNKIYPFVLKEYDNVISHYGFLSNKFELKNRDFDKWKPLLAIAKSISEGLYNAVGNFAKNQTELQKEEKISNWEMRVLGGMNKAIQFEKLNEYAPKTFFELVKGEFGDVEIKLTQDGVMKYLNKLGFDKFKVHTKTGNIYRLCRKDFLDLLEQQEKDIGKIISQDSQVTLIEDKVEEENGEGLVKGETNDK